MTDDDIQYRASTPATGAGQGFEGGKLVPTTGPAIDVEPADPDTFFAQLGEHLGVILRWVHSSPRRNPTLVGRRFIAMLYVVRPDLLGNATIEVIAKHQGVSKDTIHDLIKEFREQFKFQCRSMRGEKARANMSKAARARPTPIKESFRKPASVRGLPSADKAR